MQKARIMDTAEDFARLGVNPQNIEPWEDGRRDTDAAGHLEWWYFDAILDDGTMIVIHFDTKSFNNMFDDVAHPAVLIKVTPLGGETVIRKYEYPTEEATFAVGGCDVQIGPHRFVGNLKEYAIHIKPVEGLGADLKLMSQAQPWRPGTAYYGFGDNDEAYFTWLCCVPKGKVEGTLTIDGKTVAVTGYGYHDHQWGSANPLTAWNNWVWARQSFGNISILLFDCVTGPDYGFTRFPLAFIQDADGRIIFENKADVQCEVLDEYVQEISGKTHPKKLKYNFFGPSGDVEYVITMTDEIDVKDNYAEATPEIRAMLDHMGKHPTYTRYAGMGELTMRTSTQEYSLSGDLIYELVYVGTEYKKHIEKISP